jgi:beta-lactamase class A
VDNSELEPFKYKVERLIKERVAAGEIKAVSVYFRDLNDGPWFGINSQEQFSPASLMKLPVMIGWLKKAEADPTLLKRTLTFDDGEDWNAQQNIKPQVAIERGKKYTVEDLIYRMMAHSDNNAWHLLFKNIDVNYLDKILADLNVNYDPTKEEDFMTVKAYSSIYRILYNASYLSKGMSEKALEYLVHIDFKDGIVAGVPAGVTVASKFGERTLGNNGEIKQLHEFGIVYYPKSPYLLGVMTRGEDFGRSAAVIRDISHLVYEEINRQSKRQ